MKLKHAGALVATALLAGACTKVPAGHVGVLVNLYGSEKGVNEKVVSVGRYWVGFNEDLFLFPTYTVNAQWTAEGKDESISFQTNDGMRINGDFGITYKIDPTKVATVFQKYRKGMDEITNIYLRNFVRDALNKKAMAYSSEDLYGEAKTKLLDDVNHSVAAEVEPSGILIERISLVGELRFPLTLVNAINAKIEAKQAGLQAENELAKARAEAAKLLIESEAKAKANERLARSLTPEYIRYLMIDKWNGQAPNAIGADVSLLMGGK